MGQDMFVRKFDSWSPSRPPRPPFPPGLANFGHPAATPSPSSFAEVNLLPRRVHCGKTALWLGPALANQAQAPRHDKAHLISRFGLSLCLFAYLGFGQFGVKALILNLRPCAMRDARFAFGVGSVCQSRFVRLAVGRLCLAMVGQAMASDGQP